jgi:GNAT superfamily N-acetyltransferase
MYKEYLKEREGKDVIETDYGFVIYELSDDCIYLTDMYVMPEKRNKGLTTVLDGKVKRVGKENGCTKMLTSLCTKANNWKHSLKAIKNQKYKLYKTDKATNMIYFIKEI